jgi:hypothetical protein
MDGPPSLIHKPMAEGIAGQDLGEINNALDDHHCSVRSVAAGNG